MVRAKLQWQIVLFLMLWIFSAWILQAEISTTVTLQNFNVVSRQEDEVFALLSGINGSLDFMATGNRNVKGELQVDTFISDRIILDIPRAYLKIRFPALRLTAGKTAISWGEGFLFNAGDVVFDGMSLDTNLAASVLRNNTIFQLLLTRYLGRVSYIELVVLPAPQTIELAPGTGIFIPSTIELAELSEGGRLVLNFSVLGVETGYLYRGSAGTHNPYVSFGGSLFGIGDFFLAASCSLIQDNLDEELIKESLKTSGGISASLDLGEDYSLNLRFEAGVLPFAEWEEVSAPTQAVTYGLYLFPDISFAPVDNVSFQLRSLISPLDNSGTIFFGTNWNVYQGLTLSFLASGMFGDDDDTYGWGRENDLLFMLNLEYVFGG